MIGRLDWKQLSLGAVLMFLSYEFGSFESFETKKDFEKTLNILTAAEAKLEKVIEEKTELAKEKEDLNKLLLLLVKGEFKEVRVKCDMDLFESEDKYYFDDFYEGPRKGLEFYSLVDGKFVRSDHGHYQKKTVFKIFDMLKNRDLEVDPILIKNASSDEVLFKIVSYDNNRLWLKRMDGAPFKCILSLGLNSFSFEYPTSKGHYWFKYLISFDGGGKKVDLIKYFF